jgi:CLIP-associating protein 1/2
MTHTQPDVVPTVPSVGTASRVRSRVPHSQGSSRDGSPSRAYGGRDKRSIGGQPAGRVSLAPQLGDRLTDNDLQTAAVALLQHVGPIRRQPDEFDDGTSETSSLCSESSYRSYGNTSEVCSMQEVADIVTSLCSGSWSDRRDGLMALQNFLRSNRKLTRSELKKISEIFSRMFHDPHLKVFGVFMDTLVEFLAIHHADLHDWLNTALPRLFNKIAIDVVSSVQTKMQRTLETICQVFPYGHQLNVVSRYIVDQTASLNIKVRIVVLNYMHSLCQQMDPSDLVNTSDTRLALTRLIQWTTEPKSADIRKAAQAVIIALFNLNASELTTMLRAIPKPFQDSATKILQGHLHTSPGYEPLSPRNVVSPATDSHRHRQPLAGGNLSGSENLNPEDLFDSIRKASVDIQNLSRVDTQYVGCSGTSVRQTGDSPLALTTDRLKTYNPNHYQDDKSNGVHALTHFTDVAFDSDIFNEEFPSDGNVCGVDDIIAELSNHNSRSAPRKQAMLQLIRIIRDTQIDIWSEHFKTILLLLLETFADMDDEIRALSLRVLREIVRRQPERFSCYAELTILKLLEAHRDSVKDVNRAAEECAATVARAIPADQCINILNPFVDTAEFPVNLAAIKMQIKVIESTRDKDVIIRILPDLVPRLLKGYDNSESSVRKASVFCLVAIYLAVGEELRPFLAPLSSSKLKLLNLYIKRALTQKTDESSTETSKTSSPVSVVENFS